MLASGGCQSSLTPFEKLIMPLALVRTIVNLYLKPMFAGLLICT
jgi:hypothetical protein